MPIGYLFLFASLLGFGLLGIFHKVADHPNCRPRMVTMLLLFWGAVLTGLYTALFNPRGLHLPGNVLAVGAAGGALSSLALFAFQASLRYGKISTSWLILNLCLSVPVLLSILFYGEKVSPAKALGIVLVLAAILLLWWDKKLDLERKGLEGDKAAAPEPDEDPRPFTPPRADLELEGSGGIGTLVAVAEPPAVVASRPLPVVVKSKSKWLPLIMLAFLANGLAASSQKVLVELGGGEYVWQFYTVLYAAGFTLFAVINLLNAGWPNAREVITSAIMALASVAGNISIVKALDLQVPGSVAYPVGNGGSLFLVVLGGVLLFKERINPVGIAGIIVGLAAVLVVVTT